MNNSSMNYLKTVHNICHYKLRDLIDINSSNINLYG